MDEWRDILGHTKGVKEGDEGVESGNGGTKRRYQLSIAAILHLMLFPRQPFMTYCHTTHLSSARWEPGRLHVLYKH